MLPCSFTGNGGNDHRIPFPKLNHAPADRDVDASSPFQMLRSVHMTEIALEYLVLEQCTGFLGGNPFELDILPFAAIHLRDHVHRKRIRQIQHGSDSIVMRTISGLQASLSQSCKPSKAQ